MGKHRFRRAVIQSPGTLGFPMADRRQLAGMAAYGAGHFIADTIIDGLPGRLFDVNRGINLGMAYNCLASQSPPKKSMTSSSSSQTAPLVKFLSHSTSSRQSAHR